MIVFGGIVAIIHFTKFEPLRVLYIEVLNYNFTSKFIFIAKNVA